MCYSARRNKRNKEVKNTVNNKKKTKERKREREMNLRLCGALWHVNKVRIQSEPPSSSPAPEINREAEGSHIFCLDCRGLIILSLGRK